MLNGTFGNINFFGKRPIDRTNNEQMFTDDLVIGKDTDKDEDLEKSVHNLLPYNQGVGEVMYKINEDLKYT